MGEPARGLLLLRARLSPARLAGGASRIFRLAFRYPWFGQRCLLRLARSLARLDQIQGHVPGVRTPRTRPEPPCALTDMADTDVLFLIEAGGRYGLGHLMRSTVLMDALRARGGRPISALRLGEGELPDWTLPSTECITLERNEAAATRQAEAVAGAQQPGWVVVDGYGLLASDIVARMHAMGLRVLAFD